MCLEYIGGLLRHCFNCIQSENKEKLPNSIDKAKIIHRLNGSECAVITKYYLDKENLKKHR